MKFPRLSVEADAAEVVDSVCDVGCLLDFGDEAACSDAVDTAGRKKTSPAFTL